MKETTQKKIDHIQEDAAKKCSRVGKRKTEKVTYQSKSWLGKAMSG